MSSGRAQSYATLSDGARVRWWRHDGPDGATPSVLFLHGGPGLPDYLEDVAELLDGLAPAYRFDQRGTGGSPWSGGHTVERHVQDVVELLDAWLLPRAVLIGHSYGTELACRVALDRPDRVAGLLLIAGPFVGDWRAAYRQTRSLRWSAAQARRHRELDAVAARTEAEEVEFLTLSWCTDHPDPAQGWARASAAARTRRPVAYGMNRQLGAGRRVAPLDPRLPELQARLRERTAMIGGAEDPRPAAALRRLADELEVPLSLLDGAGHEPWLDRPDQFAATLRQAVVQWR